MIDRLQKQLPVDAAEAQQQADEALALARDTGDKLLEAEASLLIGRWMAPVRNPEPAWTLLRNAAAVFAANQMPHKVQAASASAALVLCELGEERNAIDAAGQVLAQSGLAPEVAALAVYAMALAHGRLGELDLALKWLDERGAALAQAGAAVQPLLPARLAWARARMAWQVFVHQHHPALWRGLPLEAGVLQITAAAVSREELLRRFESADALLPPGQTWPYSEMIRQVLHGLGTQADAGQAAIDALDRMVADLWARDPVAAGWSLLCQAKILLDRGQRALALQSVVRGRQLAEPLQLRGLLRDLLLYEGRILESMGDSAGALLAFKQQVIHRIRSIAVQPSGRALPQASAGLDLASHALRSLEPPHVRRALRYIDEHLRQPLSVQLVVQHCGVGRRTLEIAFKDSKGCTLADYIRRRKLDLAATQLGLTEQSVQQVALSLGFGSPSTFSREFAAQFGVPPSVWQRQHKGGKSV